MEALLSPESASSRGGEVEHEDRRNVPGHPFLYTLECPLLIGIKVGFSSQSLFGLRSRYTTAYGQRFTVHYVGTAKTCMQEETELKARLQPYQISGELFEAKCLPLVLSEWAFRYGAANIHVTSAALIATLSTMCVSRAARDFFPPARKRQKSDRSRAAFSMDSEPFADINVDLGSCMSSKPQDSPRTSCFVESPVSSDAPSVRKRSDFLGGWTPPKEHIVKLEKANDTNESKLPLSRASEFATPTTQEIDCGAVNENLQVQSPIHHSRYFPGIDFEGDLELAQRRVMMSV